MMKSKVALLAALTGIGALGTLEQPMTARRAPSASRKFVPGLRGKKAFRSYQSRYSHVLTPLVTDKNLAKLANRKKAREAKAALLASAKSE